MGAEPVWLFRCNFHTNFVGKVGSNIQTEQQSYLRLCFAEHSVFDVKDTFPLSSDGTETEIATETEACVL